jgi:Pyridoxamine 5'-phosphate oxidase
MAKFFTELTSATRDFILEQKMFFTATAPDEGRINLSPKGIDSFRILNNKTVAYIDLTGSGNESSAHIQQNGRMTFMFTSYTEMPLILRLYGQGEVVKKDSARWHELQPNFPTYAGERQIIVLHIESAQTSCGFGVPVYEHKGDKKIASRLKKWEHHLTKENYWAEKNQTSIDGLPTHIITKI